eukprot:6262543-Ditylum_brightwellii.AAC.1
MLSGIKSGKKKRKRASTTTASTATPKQQEQVKVECKRKDGMDNEAAAEELRRLFQRGAASSNNNKVSTTTTTTDGKTTSRVTSVLDALEQRGRIQSSSPLKATREEDIVLVGKAAATCSTTTTMSMHRADFKRGSRKGKLKPSQQQEYDTSEKQMTIQQMIQEEKNIVSMDEQNARNISKLGSRYKNNDLSNFDKSGADEEDAVDTTLFSSGDKKLTQMELAQRDKSRQIINQDKISSIT